MQTEQSSKEMMLVDPECFTILTLDGGGSKGAFTLGVLQKMEEKMGAPLCEHFDAIYGTSTGAIIAAYLALGFTVAQIYTNYMRIIPHVMSKWTARTRTEALRKASYQEFGKHDFTHVRCPLVIVATRCDSHQPLIFKSDPNFAHSQKLNFLPGFGVSLADCLLASAAASPFFLRKKLELSMAKNITITDAIDGGFVANNPSLYALIDATTVLQMPQSSVQLYSIGTGVFPIRRRFMRTMASKLWLLSDTIALLEETLESNANSADFIRTKLFPDVRTFRVNPTFKHTGFETDLLESDPVVLRKMYEYGAQAV